MKIGSLENFRPYGIGKASGASLSQGGEGGAAKAPPGHPEINPELLGGGG